MRVSDIQFTCPRCGHNLIVDDAGAGFSVPCPDCSEPIAIPVNVERPGDQKADFNTEVDARPADKMRTDGASFETTGTGRQEPWHRVVMRGVVRVLRVLLRWLAMALSLLGWLVQASFRWIVVIPSLNARLAHQYRKTGEQAYRNPNGEDQGVMIREQIRAIDSEAERVGSGAERGASNGMSKSHSRVALLAARMMRWHKKRRLLALLGKELVGRETANEESCRFVKQARSTLETIRRTKARRPVKCGAGNIGVGLATLLVIACAWHLGRNASGVADTGEAPAMAYDIFTGEWFPINNRDNSDSETTPVHTVQDGVDTAWYGYGYGLGTLAESLNSLFHPDRAAPASAADLDEMLRYYNAKPAQGLEYSSCLAGYQDGLKNIPAKFPRVENAPE